MRSDASPIGSLRVGGKDDIKVLVSVTGTQHRLCWDPAMRREGHIVVARRQVGSIMIRLGVYFTSDIDHGMPLGWHPMLTHSPSGPSIFD